MQPKVLIICGPTATGKTKLALELAGSLNGEIITADSRHVYVGMDIVTGKDIPPGFIKKISPLIWHSKHLPYFENGPIRIWLVDVVQPDEDFNVSFWRACAAIVIRDIHSRGKLPIVVGGTGLYLKSFVQDLPDIDLPPNPQIRQESQSLSVLQQWELLHRLDPAKANSLNSSDRHNSRRLVRAIEIASSISPSPKVGEGASLPAQNRSMNRERIVPKGEWKGWVGGEVYQTLQIGLTANTPVLLASVESRLKDRVKAGARAEVQQLSAKYSFDLPSMTASGYAAFRQINWEKAWFTSEKHLVKKQLTWFKKQPGIHWFDISKSSWRSMAISQAVSWYNSP